VIGLPRTTVFFLHLTTAWAVGYLGYYLAVHRLNKGTQEAIDVLPSPSISIGWFIVAVLWTALTAAVLYGQSMTKTLDIVFVLFYMGWIHAVLWVAHAAGDLMLTILLLLTNTEPLPELSSLLVSCVIASPFIGLLSAFLSVLFQWLLLMALVAFLGYNLAPFTHKVWYTVLPRQPPRYGRMGTGISDICIVTPEMCKNIG
jgi:hypothetical protein